MVVADRLALTTAWRRRPPDIVKAAPWRSTIGCDEAMAVHRGSARGGLRARRHRARDRPRQQLCLRAPAGHRAAAGRRLRGAALHGGCRGARDGLRHPAGALRRPVRLRRAHRRDRWRWPPAASWPCSRPRAGAATRRRCSTSARPAGARTSSAAPGSCSTRRPSPRRCCARSCGWPCRTWPSCASWTWCTTARWARRRPTPPTRARWRCCTTRACATRSTPRGRTPSPSSPARAARTCSTRSEPSACARSRSTSST